MIFFTYLLNKGYIMKKFVLILGGARSGKSSYAVELAKRFSASAKGRCASGARGGKKKVVFIATATLPDREMEKRIKLHKASRPRHWKLIEEGKDVNSILSKLNSRYGIVLIDCLGLLISNLLASNLKDRDIEKRIKRLINSILRINFTTILVSNEVGSGIVPENHLARRFRDLLGLSNQMITKKADEVIFMQSGIPIKIKNSK